MVVQVEVIVDNLLGLQVRVSQVTGQLIFWLEEANAQPKLIWSQHCILPKQLGDLQDLSHDGWLSLLGVVISTCTD